MCAVQFSVVIYTVLLCLHRCVCVCVCISTVLLFMDRLYNIKQQRIDQLTINGWLV